MHGPAKAAGVSTATPAASASVPPARTLRASPVASVPKASSSWVFDRLANARAPPYSPFQPFGPSPPDCDPDCDPGATTPSADFRAAVARLAARSVRGSGHGRGSPEVRSSAFPAHPPDLPPRPSMTVDFAVIGPLVRPGRPHIRCLSIGSRICSTLPSDPASRRRPCASLALRRHQAGQRTLTSKLSIMLGTPKNRAARRPPLRSFLPRFGSARNRRGPPLARPVKGVEAKRREAAEQHRPSGRLGNRRYGRREFGEVAVVGI